MKTILLIEDDSFLIKIYQSKLEAAGYTTHSLGHGGEAVKTAKNIKPDLILLDIIMPIKDGYTALQELKAEKETAKIPVIVLSILQEESEIKKALDLGADSYLGKTTVNFDQVIEKIESLTK